MNENTAMMKVRRMELMEQQAHLRMKAKSLCRMIPGAINPTLYEIEDMEIALAAQQMDELVMVQAELLSISTKIAELEKALGD
jgi:hypothetical protein